MLIVSVTWNAPLWWIQLQKSTLRLTKKRCLMTIDHCIINPNHLFSLHYVLAPKHSYLKVCLEEAHLCAIMLRILFLNCLNEMN